MIRTWVLLSLLGLAAAEFKVTDFQYGKTKLKVLTNTETGENASVIINYGGCVDELFLRTKRGNLKRVLWDHDRNSTAVETNPTWKGRMLLPYANRIGGATYEFNGTRQHLPINDVSGLNNSLHGLLWDKAMVVVDAGSDAKSASVTLRHTFGDGTDKGYPFKLQVDIRYTLDATGFWLQVHAKNMDPNGWPLPYYNGWHPYFLVADMSKAHIVLDNCSTHVHVDVNTGPQYPPPRHSDMVPSTHVSPWARTNGTDAIGGNTTDPTYMDDEVKVMSPEKCTEPFFSTRLVDPVLGDTTVLMHDASFRYLQIFTGAKTTWGVDAVVLEPLSSMSDAYNNHDGLHVLSAGESFTNHFGVRLE